MYPSLRFCCLSPYLRSGCILIARTHLHYILYILHAQQPHAPPSHHPSLRTPSNKKEINPYPSFIFFINPLSLPPLLPSPLAPDTGGAWYAVLSGGVAATGFAGFAAGAPPIDSRGRCTNCCVSISARPASMVAWFLEWTSDDAGSKRRSKVSLRVPRRASPAPCARGLVSGGLW
jgi:hypothetical protein